MASISRSHEVREINDAGKVADILQQVHDEKDAAAVHDELARSKAGGYIPQTSEEKHQSQALNRKFDIFLLPVCVMIYLLNGLDRSNLGNAQTGGFTKDLGIPADTINTATSLFFCTVSLNSPSSAPCQPRCSVADGAGYITVRPLSTHLHRHRQTRRPSTLAQLHQFRLGDPDPRPRLRQDQRPSHRCAVVDRRL